MWARDLYKSFHASPSQVSSLWSASHFGIISVTSAVHQVRNGHCATWYFPGNVHCFASWRALCFSSPGGMDNFTSKISYLTWPPTRFLCSGLKATAVYYCVCALHVFTIAVSGWLIPNDGRLLVELVISREAGGQWMADRWEGSDKTTVLKMYIMN